MRTIVAALLLTVPLSLIQADEAQAQNYPWCTNGTSGSRNCGFISYEQCLASVSGRAGFSSVAFTSYRLRKSPPPKFSRQAKVAGIPPRDMPPVTSIPARSNFTER